MRINDRILNCLSQNHLHFSHFYPEPCDARDNGAFERFAQEWEFAVDDGFLRNDGDAVGIEFDGGDEREKFRFSLDFEGFADCVPCERGGNTGSVSVG